MSAAMTIKPDKNGPPPQCECGCGAPVAWDRHRWRRFRKGHHWRGRTREPRSTEHRRKLSRAGLGNTNKLGKKDPRGSAAKLGARNPSYGKRGSHSKRWRGGRWISKRGYVHAWAPDHPRSVHGYVLEHKLVIEKKLGRYLKRGEIVHHIDGVKSNNKLSNLWLCDQASHRQAHHSTFDVVCELLSTGAARFDRRAGRYVLAA